MQRPSFGQRHKSLLTGFGLSVGLGCLIAFIGQTLVPSLAKLPGLILCSGGEFELVLRTRNSYGACAGGADIHYGSVLVVSVLVWSVAFSPLGLLLAYLGTRKSDRA
jgi:hypothetical protein